MTGGIKRVYTFPKSSESERNRPTRVQLAYFETAVQYFCHYATGTPPMNITNKKRLFSVLLGGFSGEGVVFLFFFFVWGVQAEVLVNKTWISDMASLSDKFQNSLLLICLNFLDEAEWFLSFRVLELFSSSSLLYSQFGWCVLWPSSCLSYRTLEPTQNFEPNCSFNCSNSVGHNKC